jgi:hypothetical protein
MNVWIFLLPVLKKSASGSDARQPPGIGYERGIEQALVGLQVGGWLAGEVTVLPH